MTEVCVSTFVPCLPCAWVTHTVSVVSVGGTVNHNWTVLQYVVLSKPGGLLHS